MKCRNLFPALFLLAACGDTTTEPVMPESEAPLASQAPALLADGNNVVDHANTLLAVQGSAYRIAQVEYLTSEPEGASANIIVARDLGNKRLDIDFIPNDPRRATFDGDPNTIDVFIDQSQGATLSGLPEASTTGAIGAAMATWDNQKCSALGMNIFAVGIDLGLVQSVFGYGGGFAISDIMHAGWLPGAFFDLIAPGGSTSILAATFSLTFTTGDLDGDGQPDLALREIYYNDAFNWGTDGAAGAADVETIALHEAGHALSQGHFGTIRINPNSGKVNFSPRAVMNAVYSGPNRVLTATDNAGHCGLWGSWPQR
jgi:hypothetical protein